MVNEAQAALDALKADGFATGPGFDRAHRIAQAHEGEPLFDWLHALCHRIEGDHGNAAYWYRRAGKAPYEGSFSEEHTAMSAEIGD